MLSSSLSIMLGRAASSPIHMYLWLAKWGGTPQNFKIATDGTCTPDSSKGNALPLSAITQSTLQFDSSVNIEGGRIYLSTSSTQITKSGVPATASFYFDFIEFALEPGKTTSKLVIDTTRVDQFGFPITMQLNPKDADFPDGLGTISNLKRDDVISKFKSAMTGSYAPFLDCVFPDPNNASDTLRLLNPKDVIVDQLTAQNLDCTIATSGKAGAWQATLTITGPKDPNPPHNAPTNGGLKVGWLVSGPLIPAGATVSQLPGSPTGSTVVLESTAQTNPYTASTTSQSIYFLPPVTTKLGNYYDDAIDQLFNYAKTNTLQVEQNDKGTDVVFMGKTIEIQNIPDIDGGSSTYTVLQFSGNGQKFNIYYPFFTTNSVESKQTPNGKPVPPPPSWWTADKGLKFYEPATCMVFSCDGVFADNVQQSTYAPSKPNSTILGGIENVVVSSLIRGHSTTWVYKNGSITPSNPSGSKSATVDLKSGEDTSGVTKEMYMFSYRIASAPMVPQNLPSQPVSKFDVTSDMTIMPTPTDLLSFAQFYPPNGTWSAFSCFFTNNMGQDITIDGRSYAFPYSDQGGFSSTITSLWQSGSTPAVATITLGAWS